MNKTQEKSDYGYDLYPERRTTKEPVPLVKQLWSRSEGKSIRHKERCERNVFNVIKNNQLIKLFLDALKSSGCQIDLKRHIVCEECDSKVTGGYDSELNQIVICQNSIKSRNSPESVLAHELVHMFDFCRGEIDFKNLEHVACSEIRAANIAHCSFISSLLLGQSSPINIKRTHQYCVKMKAAQSLQIARNIDFPTAMEPILKVFGKCYNDLEPIGRRIKKHSHDAKMAYIENKYFGFCTSKDEQ